MVFAIFAITGWDAAAPLAEESLNPRRNIPRAVIGSIVILGIFLVVVSWGQITGWGTSRLASFASSPVLPSFVLGKKYWGDGWLVVLFALFNSAIAVSIACTNASTRFLYGMARAKALPTALTRIHSRFKTPTNAILVQTGINILLGLVLPLAIGVANVYNVTGTWFTFALAFVYVVSNIGLFVFYRREHRDEFSWAKHLLIPAIGIIALAVVVYYSVNPLPAWPVSLAPFIVLGWLVVGGIVVAVVYRGDRAGNLALAGAAMGESVESAIVERYSLDHPVPRPTRCADLDVSSPWPRGGPRGARLLCIAAEQAESSVFTRRGWLPCSAHLPETTVRLVGAACPAGSVPTSCRRGGCRCSASSARSWPGSGSSGSRSG